MNRGGDGDRGDRGRQIPLNHEFLWCAAAFVVAVGLELLVVHFIHSKGVSPTGDEPSYIIQAQAYLHLSPHILSVVKTDLRTHALSAYPAGTQLSAVERFTGARGWVSPFEPGLGLLLAPFVASGRLYLGPIVGSLALNTAGLILVHRRLSRLTNLRGPGQTLLALMLAGPALFLAITQIYPDLISGVLLTSAIVEVAIIERTGKVTRFNTTVVAISAAYLPWLQIKNFFPAAVALLAYAIAARRSRSTVRAIAVVGAVVVASWALLLAYNQFYFGRILGFPEPLPHLTRSGAEYTLGLLFDRDQGLFAQVPFAVIGLVGLWLMRKKLPVAVLATVISIAGILLINGTYLANPYGGTSFVGRFMWTLIPVLIAWTAIVLARWQQAGRRFWAPIAIVVVAGAWIYQAKPILAGDHFYYNVFSKTLAWDPGTWPGWWTGLNHVLPQFDLPGHSFGSPAFAILVELAIAGFLVLAACVGMTTGAMPKVWLGAMGVVGVVVLGAVVISKPVVPSTTRRYDSAQLGAPVVSHGTADQSPNVPLQGVPPGTYRFTLAYHLGGSVAAGAASDTFVVSFSPVSGATPQTVVATLDAAHPTASVVIECGESGTVFTQLDASARSEIDVGSLQLQKTA